jgi:hypothetical protein
LYWDEIKGEDNTKRFTDITFQTTQGKEKARMRQNATQREPGSWQTLIVSASNDSLLDYVVNNVNTTTAGLYRVFEYAVDRPDVKTQLDTSVASLIVARLNDNHGCVGLEYSKFLGANYVQVERDVATTLRDLGREVKTISDERFWLALIASVLVGARYANQLGFTSFDEEALKEFMLDILKKSRAHRSTSTVDMTKDISLSTILSQFLKAMMGRHILYTNRIHITRGKPAANSIKIINQATQLQGIYVHVGVDDKLMRLSSVKLSEWLKEKGYSRHVFTTALESELGAKKVIGRLGSGCGPTIAQATEYLLEIDLAGTPYANFIDEP